MHHPPLPPGPGLSLPVAVGAILRPPELLRPRLNRHLGRHVEPLTGERRPPRPSQAPSRPGSRRSGPSGQPGDVGVCSFSGDGENSATPSPGGGPGGEFCFILFCSAAGPRVPTYSKKEQFPFPPGSQVHGTTVCDALLPHSRPRPTFASSQESTVRG